MIFANNSLSRNFFPSNPDTTKALNLSDYSVGSIPMNDLLELSKKEDKTGAKYVNVWKDEDEWNSFTKVFGTLYWSFWSESIDLEEWKNVYPHWFFVYTLRFCLCVGFWFILVFVYAGRR